MVLCRCYQTQVTSPSNSLPLSATITCKGSPPSYNGSLPYGECHTVPQSGLNYPSYLGYTSGFDGYGVYQSIYPQLSPVSKGNCLALSFSSFKNPMLYDKLKFCHKCEFFSLITLFLCFDCFSDLITELF